MRRRVGVAVLCSALGLGALVVPDGAGAAAGGPEIEAEIRANGNVRLTWLLDEAPKGRHLVIERRPPGGAWVEIRTIKRPRLEGRWTDKRPLAGDAGYRARVVVGDVAYPWSDEFVVRRAVATTTTTVPTGNRVDCPDAWEATVLDLVNAERGPNLRRDARLDSAAVVHSHYMAKRNALSHDHFGARLADAGYDYAMAGENVAWVYDGFGEPNSRVVRNWMNSTPHRQAIQNPLFVDVGVSCVLAHGKRWWTMEFGRPR